MMPVSRNAACVYQSFIVLCLIISEIQGKCKTTFITTCENASDLPRYGKQTWKNLILANDECRKQDFGPPSEILKPRAFNMCLNLEEIYIVEKLVEIQPGAFDRLEQLTYLKLHKNLVKVIPRGAFGNITQLLKLDLQDNSIENLQHGLFENSSIGFIDLSYNKLTNVQVDMVALASLKKLVITNNNISVLARDCFHANLQHLNLDHNNLQDIDQGVIAPLKDLQELILSNNKLDGIAISFSLPSLEKLDLSHNQIEGIKEESFKEFHELRVLLLGYNRLTYLNPSIFPEENNIEVIYVHENLLMSFDSRLGTNLPHLKDMSIGGNPWACSCLELVLTYFAQKKIRQAECEKEFFSRGISAVCWVTDTNTCSGNEKLSPDVAEEFRKALRYNSC